MQNAKNHLRFFPLHHFVLIPICGITFIWSLIHLVKDSENWQHSLLISLITFCVFIGAFASRISSLKNQDRIIRLEMRYRYFELSGKSFAEKEEQLTLSQIIALRFAGDDELLTLIETSISNKLSSGEIKAGIKNWKKDIRRV
jgi:hypothetical protein